MKTKFKTSCSACSCDIAVGESVTGKKIGGGWCFLCKKCTDKINEQGSSNWWNPCKALEALIYYNCELGDELDHHDWDLLRLFGITPFGV